MNPHIYPVVNAGEICDTYQVNVNGVLAPLHTARVSAAPINRRWPGHQRELSQTELINFLSLAVGGRIEFEVIPKLPFERVEIRPRSLGIQPVITENGTITFSLDKPAYFTVEPYGRNSALHIFADAVSDYHVDFDDENVFYFGPGEHEAGQIQLHSNQTVFIDEGAVVYACIKAVDAENIRILGKGILDNSHNKEIILYEASAENNREAVDNATRQNTIELQYCTNVEIEGITIRDSLVYNIRPIGCRHVHISGVKIIGCWRFNSDGIDMHNCEDVLIENCFVRTFDDCICIKGFDCYYKGDVEKAVREAMYRHGKAYDVFKRALVRHCVLWNDWGRVLEIGAETRAEEICDIVFDGCDIIHVTHDVLDCQNVDYADVHDITWKNINVEYDTVLPKPCIQRQCGEKYRNTDKEYAPYLMSATVSFHHEYSKGGCRRGKNRNLTFENIRLFGRQKPLMHFSGYDEAHRTENVRIHNLYWNGRPVCKADETQLILRDFTANISLETTAPAENHHE